MTTTPAAFQKELDFLEAEYEVLIAASEERDNVTVRTLTIQQSAEAANHTVSLASERRRFLRSCGLWGILPVCGVLLLMLHILGAALVFGFLWPKLDVSTAIWLTICSIIGAAPWTHMLIQKIRRRQHIPETQQQLTQLQDLYERFQYIHILTTTYDTEGRTLN